MALVPLVEVSLWVFGIRRTWNALNGLCGDGPACDEPLQASRKQLGYLKRSMKLSPIRGRCLARSLVLWSQLRRRGVTATLFIGVRNKKVMNAHAWLQFETHVLNAGPKVGTRYEKLANFNHPRELT